MKNTPKKKPTYYIFYQKIDCEEVGQLLKLVKDHTAEQIKSALYSFSHLMQQSNNFFEGQTRDIFAKS